MYRVRGITIFSGTQQRSRKESALQPDEEGELSWLQASEDLFRLSVLYFCAREVYLSGQVSHKLTQP